MLISMLSRVINYQKLRHNIQHYSEGLKRVHIDNTLSNTKHFWIHLQQSRRMLNLINLSTCPQLLRHTKQSHKLACYQLKSETPIKKFSVLYYLCFHYKWPNQLYHDPQLQSSDQTMSMSVKGYFVREDEEVKQLQTTY